MQKWEYKTAPIVKSNNICKIGDDIKTSFKPGRQYNMKLPNGKNVRVYMYTDSYKNVRVVYIISSANGLKIEDKSFNELSLNEQIILREMADYHKDRINAVERNKYVFKI